MENTHNAKHRDYTIEDLEELLDKIPYELWIKDENGRHKYINKIGAERMGLKKEDIIGKTDFEFRPYNMAKDCAEGDQKVLKNDVGILSEDKIELENGDKWYEVYKVSFENSKKDGKLIGGIGKEISVDKSLKDCMISSFISAINNNEFPGEAIELDIINKLKDRLLAKDIAVYLYDSEKNLMTLDINTCNDKRSFCDTYSFSEQEKIILEDSRYIPVKVGLKNKKYAYPIKFKQHILGALLISYDKIPKYIQEDIIKYTCIVMYIMLDNKQLSKALNKELIEKKSTQKILKMVINTVIDAYALLEVQGYKAEWIDMSKRCTDIFGWVCEEVNKMTLLELLHPDDSERLKRIMSKGVQEYNNFICRILFRNNEYKYVDLNWSNLHDNLYIVTARDITSASEDCRNIIIKVSNDGLPIDKNSAKKIFGRFTQIDNLLTRSSEGSGIGLSLVKSLVEIHKGRIYVNTEKLVKELNSVLKYQ